MDEKLWEQVKREREASLEFYKDWEYTGREVWIPGRQGPIRTLWYEPVKRANDMPVFFDIHGGGHTVHKAEADQPFCRKLCEALQGIVISIDYHLAPEAQWPTQIHEIYDVVKHVWSHAEQYRINPLKMGIGGHSAGGNLTAITMLMAGELKEFTFSCQLLTYPEVDLATLPEEKFEGKAEAMVEQLQFFNRCYLNEKEKKNPYFSPYYAETWQLKGQAPAIIVLCEHDILYREGLLYAMKLIESGVETSVRLFPGTEHGFTADYYYTEEAQRALQYMVDSICRYLS